MEAREIKEKNLWEGFLSQAGEKTFLQSWNWGEFSQKMGNKIWRLGLWQNNQLSAAAMIIRIKAKRGTFLFAPHGPLILEGIDKKTVLEFLLEHFKKTAQKEKAAFVRVAPLWERNQENKNIFQNLGFRSAPIHINPELTWELDLKCGEEALLNNMRKTTRYLIRKARKDNKLKVEQKTNKQGLDIFYNLYKKTARRHDFTPFSYDFIAKELETFSKDNQISLFVGTYDKKVVSSSIAVFWQEKAFYHHGASKRSKKPVSYALQWEMIKEAIKRKCDSYNFWGIADQEPLSKKHPWYGLSLFKMGFGGRRKAYVKTQDYILSPSYWFNFAIETIRKKQRGF